jgi:hypothetical protein
VGLRLRWIVRLRFENVCKGNRVLHSHCGLIVEGLSFLTGLVAHCAHPEDYLWGGRGGHAGGRCSR